MVRFVSVISQDSKKKNFWVIHLPRSLKEQFQYAQMELKTILDHLNIVKFVLEEYHLLLEQDSI